VSHDAPSDLVLDNMPAFMKIFAGPPGTGKTYAAAREAVRILMPGADEAAFDTNHRRLVEEGRIIWVTFHPSFSYEDFVEGFRPEPTETGAISYRIVPGPFLRACQATSTMVSANRFSVGQILGLRDQYEVAHVEAGGLVLKARAVTREDAVADTAYGFVDFWTLRRFEEAGLGVDALRIPGSQNERKQEIARKVGLPTTFFANSGRHAAVYDYLRQAGTSAGVTPIVLVIDEINRADLSRVFGELITLLEFDKRQGAAEERRVLLTYSQKPFSVPSELSIIGTMNTADKSLSSVDLALRRRFEFILVSPDPSRTPVSYGGLNVRLFFGAMNRRLAHVSGIENSIGHADYMELKMEELRIREGFKDSSDGKVKAFAQTLRTKTVPFLIDLFRSDWNRVRAVVGSLLFESMQAPNDIPEEILDIIDVDAVGLWSAAEWWDPKAGSWDPSRFLAALRRYQVPAEASEFSAAVPNSGPPAAAAGSTFLGTPATAPAPAGPDLVSSAIGTEVGATDSSSSGSLA
jgi:5-methylcytosine-specific restriction protein B